MHALTGYVPLQGEQPQLVLGPGQQQKRQQLDCDGEGVRGDYVKGTCICTLNEPRCIMFTGK
jgi:hypothetical protein